MPVRNRRFWLVVPLVLAVACSFDRRGLGPTDAGSVRDGNVAGDGQGSDVRAEPAQHDAAVPADLGAADLAVGDLGTGDRSGDTTCAPQCGGKLCGAADGCGGTCQAGSGCCTPQCDRAVCGGHDGCGGTCHGDNADPCGAPAETWRCVWIDAYDTYGSQVCRGGTWQTYSLSPRSCSGCCGVFSPDCCPDEGCYS